MNDVSAPWLDQAASSTARSIRRRRVAHDACAAIAAVVATLILGVPGATAATPSTDYSTNLTRFESPHAQASGQWAQRLRTVPDLNGDGKNEILVVDHQEAVGGVAVAGRVYMQDGATRSIMYFIDSPQVQAGAQFGYMSAVIGDVDGDAKADFVAGANRQDTLADGTPCLAPATGPLGNCNQDQGKAWVFSGADGDTLYEINHPAPQGFSSFSLWTGRAGDINNDAVADVIIGSVFSDQPAGCGNGPDGRRLAASALPGGCRADEGAAYIFSGKVGDHAGGASGLLRSLALPASDRTAAPCGGTGVGVTPCGSFGLPVQGVGDVTGDGVVDQQVGAASFNFDTATNGPCTTPAPTCNKGQGTVYLFSGATGALIRRTDAPAPQAGAQWGVQDAEPLAPGDVDGDGRDDYFANGTMLTASGHPTAGRSWVFSGATGAVLYEVKDPNPGQAEAFGFSMSRTDYDKNGLPDLYVGQNPHHSAGPTINGTGGTYVFNGQDGSLLKSLEMPEGDAQRGDTGNIGSSLGYSSISPGDLNDDGEPDYVAGAPFTDAGPAGFNCQAPMIGCVKDVGREYFFYSNVPAATPTAPPSQTPSPTPTPTPTPAPAPAPAGAVLRKRPGLTAQVSPTRDRRRPYRFTTRGKLTLPAGVGAAAGCRGSVRITTKRQGSVKTLSSRLVFVRRSCTFSSPTAMSKRTLSGRRGTLRITIRFQGNAQLLPRTITRMARYG